MGVTSQYDPSLHGSSIDDPKISLIDECIRIMPMNHESTVQTKLAPKANLRCTRSFEQAQDGSRNLLAPGYNAGSASFDVQLALPSISDVRPTTAIRPGMLSRDSKVIPSELDATVRFLL